MLTSDFRNAVLLDPINQGADHLKIVTGYATHTMASWHMGEICDRFTNLHTPIEITLLVGMCGYDGLSIPVHTGFQRLMNESAGSNQVRFTAQYVYKGAPVHSKLYLWEREQQPILAYMGSANYTQTAFSRRRREMLEQCEPTEAFEYFESVEPDSIYCNHVEVEEHIVLRPAHQTRPEEGGAAMRLRGAGVRSVTLSFLARETGETGQRSGINWGQRTGREPNQAYIPLPAPVARSGFFPLEKQHFSVLTDDGRQLILRVEQQNNKAITTPTNNSLLGEYFRNRLGLPNGAFVTRADFERYGRTNVTFYKLDDEQFFMDFSV